MCSTRTLKSQSECIALSKDLQMKMLYTVCTSDCAACSARVIPQRSKRLSWSNTTPMDFIKAALEKDEGYACYTCAFQCLC